jgi:hypothetical protein
MEILVDEAMPLFVSTDLVVQRLLDLASDGDGAGVLVMEVQREGAQSDGIQAR